MRLPLILQYASYLFICLETARDDNKKRQNLRFWRGALGPHENGTRTKFKTIIFRWGQVLNKMFCSDLCSQSCCLIIIIVNILICFFCIFPFFFLFRCSHGCFVLSFLWLSLFISFCLFLFNFSFLSMFSQRGSFDWSSADDCGAWQGPTFGPSLVEVTTVQCCWEGCGRISAETSRPSRLGERDETKRSGVYP